jgi:hypothetical protein
VYFLATNLLREQGAGTTLLISFFSHSYATRERWQDVSASALIPSIAPTMKSGILSKQRLDS